MPSRRIIQDSDDEADFLSPVRSPEKELAFTEISANPKESPAMPAGTDSSTDPILFQKIYDNQHRAAMEGLPQGFLNSAQLPILEDHIINQDMSSSPIPLTSIKRLKRSKTMNTSSLTSVTSPHEEQPKAKRAKSMRDMDQLTQMTSPGNSANKPEGDIWDYTISSDPKPGPLKINRRGKQNVTKEKKTYGTLHRSTSVAYSRSSQSDASASNEMVAKDVSISNVTSSGQDREELFGSSGTKEKKTYGKLRRARTMALCRSSQSEVMEDERPMSKDDSHFSRKRRASPSQDPEVAPMAPKNKKQKQDLQNALNGIENTTVSSSAEMGRNVPVDNGSSLEDARVEIPQTASSGHAVQPDKPFDLSFAGGSIVTLPRMKSPQAERTISADNAEKSTSSNIVIPATFTEIQKPAYETMRVFSTNPGYRSEQAQDAPESEMGTYDHASSNGTEQPNSEAGTKKILSSSPSVAAPSRKLKRAKSSAGVEIRATKSQALDSSGEPITSTALPILKCSKTTASSRPTQYYVDELSYTKSQEVERDAPSKASAKEPRIKGAKQAEARVSPGELFGSEDIGIPREQYQPRPSKRRAKSMVVTSSAEDVLELDSGFPPPPPRRRHSVKAAKQNSEAVFDEALAQQNTIVTTENDKETAANDIAEISAHKTTVETTLHTKTSEDAVSSGNTTLVRPPENGNQQGSKMIVLDSSQEEEILVPNTTVIANTTETEMAATKTAKQQEISLVVQKRRGRRPGVANAEKTSEVTDESSVIEGPPDLTEPAENAAAALAKRRGRTSKLTEKVLETAEETESLCNDEILVEDVAKNTRNSRRDDYDQDLDNEATDRSWSKPANFLVPRSTPPERTAAPPLVTPTKNIKKGPDHSPLPSSKVPYRVGLSKRSRIAPLLKMIKK